MDDSGEVVSSRSSGEGQSGGRAAPLLHCCLVWTPQCGVRLNRLESVSWLLDSPIREFSGLTGLSCSAKHIPKTSSFTDDDEHQGMKYHSVGYRRPPPLMG